MAGSFRERSDAASSLVGAIKYALSVFWSYLVLGARYLVLGRHDVVVVGHPGYFHIHLAKVLIYLRKHRPLLVYDIFIPLYNTVVEDRGIVAKYSAKARCLYAFEASCCKQAKINLIDTNRHGAYISSEFGVDPDTVVRVFVGSTLKRGEMDAGISAQKNKFGIVFVGTYIPLHGVETILKAAERLLAEPDIEFTLVGSGQLKEEMASYASDRQLHNVKFVDWVEPECLSDFMRKFDVALGVFGATEKALRVIPTKVFDICAVGLPFITSDSEAIREVFEHEVNCYLVPPGDALALAKAIEALKSGAEFRGKLARGTAEIYRTKLCPNSICDPLLAKIEAIRGRQK
jgi:glycosyltransferase involved in cell wall biosynthesis